MQASVKATAALDSDISDEPTQNKLKAFWKGFTFPDAIKNNRVSWEEFKISTLKGVWKKLIPTHMNDSEGFDTLVEQVKMWTCGGNGNRTGTSSAA